MECFGGTNGEIRQLRLVPAVLRALLTMGSVRFQ